MPEEAPQNYEILGDAPGVTASTSGLKEL